MKIIFYIIMGVLTGCLLTACMNNTSGSDANYEGEDISGIAEITRDKETKKAFLKINTNDKWKLYAGNRVRTINLSRSLLEGEGSGTFPLEVPDSVRMYFQLVTDKGKALLSERHLPMAGGYNFRDMGGIKTQDGSFVKWGRIFRSDDLSNLTEADLKYLSSIPIISVVDFRSQSEIEKAPDRIPQSAHNYYKLSVSPGNLTSNKDSLNMDAFLNMNLDSVMTAINIQLVTDPASIQVYKEFFNLVKDRYSIPLLFHCTAGKDRTGMAAALFLLALGVDEETVMNDYLLSNQYIKAKFASYVAQYPQFAPLAGVKASYLQAGLDRIKADHGSIEKYLKDVLDVDTGDLKEKFLYVKKM